MAEYLSWYKNSVGGIPISRGRTLEECVRKTEDYLKGYNDEVRFQVFKDDALVYDSEYDVASEPMIKENEMEEEYVETLEIIDDGETVKVYNEDGCLLLSHYDNGASHQIAWINSYHFVMGRISVRYS